MDLITLRKNLTSDNVPKEDRIAALHKLEFLLRSTANLGTGRLREDSKSKRTSLSAHGRPTSSYPFEDPSRDSMASLISRSGYDDEEKIPIGTPVSKFRVALLSPPQCGMSCWRQPTFSLQMPD